MKNKQVLTKERLIILICGAVLLTAGGVYRFYPSFAGFFDKGFSASEQERLVAKYKEKAALLDTLEERHVFLTGYAEKLSGYLIDADSPELAGVEIQKMVREMTSEEDIKLRSIKTLKPEAKSDKQIVAVPVRLVFSSTIRQLKNALLKIEGAEKLMAVSGLRVIKPGLKEQDDLNVVMTVQGFMDKTE